MEGYLLGLAEPHKTKELALGVVVHGAVLRTSIARHDEIEAVAFNNRSNRSTVRPTSRASRMRGVSPDAPRVAAGRWAA